MITLAVCESYSLNDGETSGIYWSGSFLSAADQLQSTTTSQLAYVNMKRHNAISPDERKCSHWPVATRQQV